MTVDRPSLAVIAAAEAQAKVNVCLENEKSFRLEAGAGAGKTYSLVEALKRLIAKQGTQLLQSGKKVACITFTEVARDEIAQEIEQHPAILVATIHAFAWSLMSQFQSSLRSLVNSLEDRKEKIIANGGIGSKNVEYNHGFFNIDEKKISLGHDDIPKFMAKLLELDKFRHVLKRLYPVIFIDEYQDTNQDLMNAISRHFFYENGGPLIGLFGDHWQTIYRGDFKLIEFPIVSINKGANFRSAPAIVNVLNGLRPDLPQAVKDSNAEGEARFFHTNSYDGERIKSSHSKNDLPAVVSRAVMKSLLKRLEFDGWDLSPKRTKVLMLTHSALASEQGYPTIAKIFDRSEAFAKKEDPVIAFFADTLEPMCQYYAEQKYGNMFKVLGGAPAITSHADKIRWRNSMNMLYDLRENGSIGDVLDHLKTFPLPHLPEKVMRREQDLNQFLEESTSEEPSMISRHRALRAVAYREVIELLSYIEGNTPFATQHSVKGAEFDNVLVFLGGGWNHYNWPQLLEILETNAINDKNQQGFYRARNLFYVSISRPKKRLAVLATQPLSESALMTVKRLFGKENVEALAFS